MSHKTLLWLTFGSAAVLLIDALTDKDGSGGVFFNNSNGYLRALQFGQSGALNVGLIGVTAGSAMLALKK